MANPTPSMPPGAAAPVSIPVPSDAGSATVWERISSWVAENKAVVYTIAGVAVVVTGAGVVYYLNAQPTTKPETKTKLSKKERRKKEAERKAAAVEAEKAAAASAESATKASSPTTPRSATVESADELPVIDETSVLALSQQQRDEYAVKLKQAGNSAYGGKDYNRAIDLYTQAIICKADPIYYSNRAACYNALGEWEKVVADTTAAIVLDPEYVKALNRRAKAYEELRQYSAALLDLTASCIIENFKNQNSAEGVERLLKLVAEEKAKNMIAERQTKLPSHTFVGNYLQSFRVKPRPVGLEEPIDVDPETGIGQLVTGLRALEKKTGDGYEEARVAFDKALELGGLGDHEALAFNMRGTFRCLLGKHEEAMADLTQSIALDPSMTQSYIKRASMNLELGDPNQAAEDFEAALQQNKNDPDIYYHRAQLHFIKGEYSDAQKDYQKSIDLDRDFIFSHIQLGVTQYKMGSIASSTATFRRCIKMFPKVPDVYNYYGELLLDQGQHEEAINKFDTAIEMEKQSKPMAMNVLPLINKALALFQWKQDFGEAEKLCEKALIIDPECDIAVATMAQLLLQRGSVAEALKYFERAAELARTEGEIVNALSYAEATRTQLEVQEKYPKLAAKLQQNGMNPAYR